MKLTLTIVIPAYNEQENLGATLESIARQSLAPDEVIVVDNNSTDATAQVAAAYPFVTVIAESQQGIVYAHRAGFNLAHSQLIARIDAETLLPPSWVEKVQRFYAAPAHAATTLAGGGYLSNLHLPWLTGFAMRNAFRTMQLALGHNPLWGPNFVVPREVWAQVGQTTCDLAEFDDLDLSLHLHAAQRRVHWGRQLRVGAQLRHCDTLADFWRYCMRWPQTLRRHHPVKAAVSVVIIALVFPMHYLLVVLLRK